MDTHAVLAQAYDAFNRRDIEAALALMTDDVSWPKASEGGRVAGKDEVRAYWLRQWSEFDPHVEPIGISEQADGEVRVRVHQVVKDLAGGVLFDGEVMHVFIISDGRIASMRLGDPESASPSAAFRNH